MYIHTYAYIFINKNTIYIYTRTYIFVLYIYIIYIYIHIYIKAMSARATLSGVRIAVVPAAARPHTDAALISISVPSALLVFWRANWDRKQMAMWRLLSLNLWRITQGA